MLEYFEKELYQGVGEAISVVLNTIFSDLNLTQAEFEKYIPGISLIANILNSVGWSMLVILLALCAYKSMISPDGNSEHPFYLACRAILAGAAIAFHKAFFVAFISSDRKLVRYSI